MPKKSRATANTKGALLALDVQLNAIQNSVSNILVDGQPDRVAYDIADEVYRTAEKTRLKIRKAVYGW